MSLEARVRLFFYLLTICFFSEKYSLLPALNDFIYKLSSFSVVSHCALLFAVVFFQNFF